MHCVVLKLEFTLFHLRLKLVFVVSANERVFKLVDVRKARDGLNDFKTTPEEPRAMSHIETSKLPLRLLRLYTQIQ
jgi:hypothetical protein